MVSWVWSLRASTHEHCCAGIDAVGNPPAGMCFSHTWKATVLPSTSATMSLRRPLSALRCFNTSRRIAGAHERPSSPCYHAEDSVLCAHLRVLFRLGLSTPGSFMLGKALSASSVHRSLGLSLKGEMRPCSSSPSASTPSTCSGTSDLKHSLHPPSIAPWGCLPRAR